MKAVAVFPEERALRLVDHREPAILAPGDVVVKVLDVGFCGTDREIAAFRMGSPPRRLPLPDPRPRGARRGARGGLLGAPHPPRRPRRPHGAPPLPPRDLPGLPHGAPRLLPLRRVLPARHQGRPRLPGRALLRRRPLAAAGAARAAGRGGADAAPLHRRDGHRRARAGPEAAPLVGARRDRRVGQARARPRRRAGGAPRRDGARGARLQGHHLLPRRARREGRVRRVDRGPVRHRRRGEAPDRWPATSGASTSCSRPPAPPPTRSPPWSTWGATACIS